MALIRRKKKVEEEETEENSRKRKLKSKSIEQKKGRKKESSKPWGKKERYLVLGVLVTTSIASIILSLSAREWKLPGLPRISLPSFESKPIVIEGNIKDFEKVTHIKDEFSSKTKELSGIYGFYVRRLNGGFGYGENEMEEFEPASLNKLPVMIAMFVAVEEGSISLETKYKLKNEDKIRGSGSLYIRPEGYELSYRDLVLLMGKESDNTAFNIARNILGEEKINKVIEEIGMGNTQVFGEDQFTTPYDIGILFSKLVEGELISSAHSEEILGYLTDTVYEQWLVAGISSEIRVAHKFGRETHVVNDAGVVFTEDPFIVVILSKGVVEREADKVFPELARLIFKTESKE